MIADYECCLTLEGIFSTTKKLDGLTHKLLLFHTIIGHVYVNHIKFEVSLYFWRIWPTVRRSGELAASMASLPAKNLPWRPCCYRYFTSQKNLLKYLCSTFQVEY